MRKFAFAASVLLVSFAFANAEEFRAVITKVDGDNVTFHKLTGGGKGKKSEKGEAMTLSAKGAKVVKGKFNPEAKKLEAGEALEKGLQNEVFAKEANVRITTSDDGKTITEIMYTTFGKKGKKKADTE